MRDLLKAEGLTDEQITVEKDFVIEDENGFISWRYEHGYPYMAHYVTTHPRTFEKGLL